MARLFEDLDFDEHSSIYDIGKLSCSNPKDREHIVIPNVPDITTRYDPRSKECLNCGRRFIPDPAIVTDFCVLNCGRQFTARKRRESVARSMGITK